MSGNPLVLSCEHASNHVPAAYRKLFSSPAAQKALESHRGHDIGALWLAKWLASELDAPLCSATVTRLLVDANRSEGNRHVFSEFSRALRPDERANLLAKYYRPHWQAVESMIDQVTSRTTLHLAVHSFTPKLRGKRRTADIAFLYDPARPRERDACAALCAHLRTHTELRVRRNYPYRGDSDGMTTVLRTKRKSSSYLGIELEVNQALLTPSKRTSKPSWMASLAAALREITQHLST